VSISSDLYARLVLARVAALQLAECNVGWDGVDDSTICAKALELAALIEEVTPLYQFA